MKKKLITLMLFIVLVLSLTACGPKPKEFSGSGITIELTDSFVEKEIEQASLYLESSNIFFTGFRESKTELEEYDIDTLEDYITAILSDEHSEANIETYEEDEIFYYYAYYTSIVNEIEYGYMLIVMAGENHFYSMNFGCLETRLERYKNNFFEWAETIIVE